MRACPAGLPVKAHALCALPGFPTSGFGRRPVDTAGATEGQIEKQASNYRQSPAPFGVAEVIEKVAVAAFGKPLITNVMRGLVVEAMIALVLEPEWHWCGADYNAWDFERADGLRLEVKQSAARQSWSTAAPSKAIFDVAARTGRFDGATWLSEAGRAAQIYVFAYHEIFDVHADHRDPAQWSFYVVPTASLPEVKQIALGTIKTLSSAVPISALALSVDAAARSIAEQAA